MFCKKLVATPIGVDRKKLELLDLGIIFYIDWEPGCAGSDRINHTDLERQKGRREADMKVLLDGKSNGILWIIF